VRLAPNPTLSKLQAARAEPERKPQPEAVSAAQACSMAPQPAPLPVAHWQPVRIRRREH
jgi:hypothetical protein